jgi:ElaB/YqjD/DUF883 family membrane-anchored ribosome-binding protein
MLAGAGAPNIVAMNAAPPESHMKQDIEKITAGIATLLEEADGLLHSTAAGAEAKLDAGGHEARDALLRIRGHLRDARNELRDGARKVDAAVHAHPWQTLAAGAIVGFVAGLLVRRR